MYWGLGSSFYIYKSYIDIDQLHTQVRKVVTQCSFSF
jgi:hypothetical protein